MEWISYGMDWTDQCYRFAIIITMSLRVYIVMASYIWQSHSVYTRNNVIIVINRYEDNCYKIFIYVLFIQINCCSFRTWMQGSVALRKCALIPNVSLLYVSKLIILLINNLCKNFNYILLFHWTKLMKCFQLILF